LSRSNKKLPFFEKEVQQPVRGSHDESIVIQFRERRVFI